MGVVSLNEWDEVARIQCHATQKKLIFPWQLWRFMISGSVWPEQEVPGVGEWPAGATVCQCTGVTRGAISHAVEKGASTVNAVTAQTGAGSVCGSCKPLVNELLGHTELPDKDSNSNTLTVSAVAGMIIALLFLLPLQLPYANSIQNEISWDWLWRDSLAKQVTGYTVLGLFATGLLVSLRKRWKKVSSWGSFDAWRIVHILLGIITLAVLFLHTGLRTGSGLNFLLMICFIGLVVLGSIYTGILGQQHRISASRSIVIKKRSIRWHIYLFWPVPVLLGYHVLKSYWF